MKNLAEYRVHKKGAGGGWDLHSKFWRCLPTLSPFYLSNFYCIIYMSILSPSYRKLILGVSIIITIVSLASLPYLYENISGDNIPNRPQGEPPIEYQWDTAISRTIIALISLGIGIYSYYRARNPNR